MKKFVKFLLTFSVFTAIAFGMVACSSGSDDNAALLTAIAASTYTITFNANDGSENPATATQTFTAGTPQALKTIAELGFSKNGFNFAGWGTSSDASESSYADGVSYTASANATLYALWSAIPVYSVNTPVNEHGTVTANPATATAGTEITLSNTPNAGYQFASYTVTDEDGASVNVTDGKFTMPAKNVTVTATFNAINYNINIGTIANGSVTASPASATAGTEITLTATPKTNCYALGSFTVVDANSNPVSVDANGKFTMPAQNVTVTATFSPIRPGSPYTVTGSQEINSKPYDLVTFGSWPQTLKTDGVSIDQNVSLAVGELIYYMGSDGYWYAKLSDKYYKVEPIKWRVLTTSYNETVGKKLLFAESILIGKDYDYDASSNNYQNSEIRKWLNSNANSAADSDHGGSGGFLKTAFTAAEQSAIAPASVDNSARSTNPDANATQWNGGYNQYASDTPTTDKVFLLSEREATTNSYGFDVYDARGAGNKRIRVTTDYAEASGVDQSSTAGMGGWWWLRSPSYDDDYSARYVYYNGDAHDNHSVDHTDGGVVPALCVTATSSTTNYYTVTCGHFANGSVTASHTSAPAGTTVTLTITPASGYELATLAVTDAGGASVSLGGAGYSRTFTMPASNVTVSETFAKIPAASGAYTPAGTTTINGTQYDLVTFGLWPQTVKASTVDINESETKIVGEFTYYKGSDGQWYAKLSDKYYKVEPIKWRVLTTSYNETVGKKLLLAESALIGKRYDASKNNYQNSEIRKWLNSNANSDAASDHTGSGGFLKTAFTDAEQSAIAPASVDNSARSTNPDANATAFNNGANPNASGTPTTDKVFLLSEREATTSAYGFDVYNAYKGDGTHNESTRIRQTTDYAKASGAYQHPTDGMGGWWWLRSPDFNHAYDARSVDTDGSANIDHNVGIDSGGVVPALSIAN